MFVVNTIKNDTGALISASVISLIVSISVISGFFIDEAVVMRVDLDLRNAPPSMSLPLGADPAGRNMIPQLLLGARNSFAITFAVTILCTTIGTFIGLVSGFYGGKVDYLVMRILDFFMMLPTLMIIISIVATVEDYGLISFITIMTCFLWADRARLIRTKTLQQTELGYVSASKTLGTPSIIIMIREVLPNLSPIIIVNTTLTLAANMGLETGLSFLGFGLPLGTPSLGSLISHAATPAGMMDYPWQWLPATALVFIMMLCIYKIGRSIARAVSR